MGSLGPMAARDIDDYLAGLDETKRSTLQQLRRYIRDALPDVAECISYGTRRSRSTARLSPGLPRSRIT